MIEGGNMKKILFIFLFFFLLNNIYAKEYITYSSWGEEYPDWLDTIFIESENRYLWYREVLNEETNELEREETTEYYKELDGYIKIEESLKTFYRYITNNLVLFDSYGNIVYDDAYCNKNYCSLKRIPDKPIEENPNEIENPKTYDNIFVFLIISFISFVSIVVLIKLRKINLVMSNQMKKI